MSLVKNVYRFLFRRSSGLAVTVVVAAVIFERAFDQGGDALYEYLNEGVSLPDRAGRPKPRACVAVGGGRLKVRRLGIYARPRLGPVTSCSRSD